MKQWHAAVRLKVVLGACVSPGEAELTVEMEEGVPDGSPVGITISGTEFGQGERFDRLAQALYSGVNCGIAVADVPLPPNGFAFKITVAGVVPALGSLRDWEEATFRRARELFEGAAMGGVVSLLRASGPLQVQ